MYKYLASVRVAAPVEAVFAFYCDPANWQPTLPNLLALEMQGEPPFELGTRWRQRRRLLWMAQDSDAEVVSFDPAHDLEIRIRVPKLDEAGGTLHVAHHMQEEAGGTRWFVGAKIEMPQPIPRLADWLFFTPMRWSAGRDLRAFKRAIERSRKNVPSS
jgi:uncharacterized protein YndB with AHSA1/START domain